jgi:hypothetical protein
MDYSLEALTQCRHPAVMFTRTRPKGQRQRAHQRLARLNGC